MTNLEALKATVGKYPLAENTYLKALIDRGLTSSATYAGISEAFELATADVYVVLSTAAHISEGGFTVSVTEKANLLKLANTIFAKYGYPVAGGLRQVRSVNPW